MDIAEAIARELLPLNRNPQQVAEASERAVEQMINEGMTDFSDRAVYREAINRRNRLLAAMPDYTFRGFPVT